VAIDYDDSTTQAELATEVASELGAVGIQATPRPHKAEEYAAFLANGSPELFRLGWVGDFASADAFISPLFVSGAPENVAHVSNPTVDSQLAAGRKAAAPARRNRAYRSSSGAVLGTFAVAPVVQFDTRLLAVSTVRELDIDPLGGFDPTGVWLARSSTAR
jgi:ABC-type oligopeptide transport system substrate-binding subunit